MAYYNPDTTQAGIDRRLSELLRDAVVAADPEVNFADYDAVFIFHAGVGQDLLFDDPTPRDIPSAFLNFRELKAALAPDDPGFQGIPVEGGTHFIRDGTWVPETEVQEGIEFSLLGVMANLFGSQLGLPSLFNTESGAPGIGDFGLMDQGAGNELGKLPAAPCAWSRFFLGFSSPGVVRQGTEFPVAATLAGPVGDPPLPDLALIPIDSREYYLIENRQQEIDQDPGFTLIDSLGTIVGAVANEYDGAIPGSGLLIWHIDEEVIRNGLELNQVNADFERRGVDLEEADGVQDIGIRPVGGFGLAADCYRQGNATRFATDTSPSTLSNYGHQTHITVSNVSASGPLMTFDVGDDITQAGWPDSTLASIGLPRVSLAAEDLDFDFANRPEIVFLSADGILFALRGDGESEVFPRIDFDDPAVPGAPPLIADIDPLAGAEIVVTTRSGVRVVDARGNAGSLSDWARLLTPVADGGPIAIPAGSEAALAILAVDSLHIWQARTNLPSIAFPPAASPRSNLAYDGSHLLFAAGSEIFKVDPRVGAGDPQVINRFPCPGTGQVWVLPGTFPRAEDEPLGLAVVSQEEGRVWILDGDGAAGSGWPRHTGERHLAPPALADLDEDGRLDLLVPGEGRVWAFTATGALLPGWPADLDTSVVGVPLVGGPVISDLDGDNHLDVAVVSPRGGFHGFDAAGEKLSGWPLPGGDANLGSPVLTDLDRDEDIEIASAASDGWLHVYDLSGPADRLPPASPLPVWSGYGGPAHSFAFTIELEPEEEGEELLPESELAIYPNPSGGPTHIRYRSENGASVSLTILDATGRTIRSLEHPVEIGGLNEFLWDGEDSAGDPVPSGVYVCRIAAKGTGETVEHLRTIAVMR
jgi:M6 family metalloprotease-like protein